MVFWVTDALVLKGRDGKGDDPYILPGGREEPPCHTQNPSLGQMCIVVLEGLRRVEIVLRERIDSRRRGRRVIRHGEFDDVVRLTATSYEAPALANPNSYIFLSIDVSCEFSVSVPHKIYDDGIDLHRHNRTCVMVHGSQYAQSPTSP